MPSLNTVYCSAFLEFKFEIKMAHFEMKLHWTYDAFDSNDINMVSTLAG